MATILDQFLRAIGHPHQPVIHSEEDSTPTYEGDDKAFPDGGPSTTVFCGEPGEWLAHLRIPWENRGGDELLIEAELNSADQTVTYHARARGSEEWASWLNRGVKLLRERLLTRPMVRQHLLDRFFKGGKTRILVQTSDRLPAWSTREIRFKYDLVEQESRILLKPSLLLAVMDLLRQQGDSDENFLGTIWPVMQTLMLQMMQSSYPRDRFIERIDATTIWAMINLHVLYEGKSSGRLQCTHHGEIFERWMSAQEGVERDKLFKKSRFFSLLNDLSFLANEKSVDSLLSTARVIVRDHLDSGYLRLSLAGIMPITPPWLRPMPFAWKSSSKIQSPKPELGHYGIIDEEDLDAWKNVRGPLEDIGYLIIGQLGMGQFGRVYEALNVGNGNFPDRVAVKVDRFRKGHKKEAIEAAETIMHTATGLAGSPHVIRVFDAGRLRKIRSTYHILQLVEGDTLDHLLGIAGMEHASILRPTRKRASRLIANSEFMKALSGTAGEAWRKARQSSRFRRPPQLGELFDLLTSKALWVEEVHDLGFAVNDLKNGNEMINRRGQFKGIDLDSYSPIFSPLDRLPDFFFLGVAAFQLITCGSTWYREAATAEIRQLITDPRALKQHLADTWTYGDISKHSNKRVSTPEVISFLCDFIENSRSGRFAQDHSSFGEAIDHLILMKRQLSGEELVLE